MEKEKKIELFDKFMSLQTEIVVARFLLSKEPLGYVNGEGMENFIKLKSIENKAGDAITKLIEENPNAKEVIHEIRKSGRKFTSEQQKECIEKVTGRKEDLDMLFERIG